MKEKKSIEEQAASLTEQQKSAIKKIGKYGTIGILVISIPVIIFLIMGLIIMITDPLLFTDKALKGFKLLVIVFVVIMGGIFAFIKIKFPYYSDKLARYILKNKDTK